MTELLYEVRGPKTLMEMTWPEVEELLRETDIALMSVGAVEQHGYHLPLGTDTIQSTQTMKVASRILWEEFGTKCAVAPTITWGINHGAMEYPGSITLKTDTLKQLLIDVCESLYHHGFRNIILFLGHDENYGAMMTASQDLVEAHPDMKVVVLNPMPALKASERESLRVNTPKKPDGHAGAGETSRGLCLYPNLVYLDRARPDRPKPPDTGKKILGGEPPLLGGGVFNPAADGRGYSRQAGDPGQTGDPALGSAEAGLKAYEAMGRVVAQVAHKLFVEKA